MGDMPYLLDYMHNIIDCKAFNNKIGGLHKMQPDHVYIKVSNDEYRLIEAIADTAEELGKIVGVKPNVIRSAISHAKKNGFNCSYERVEFDKDDEIYT